MYKDIDYLLSPRAVRDSAQRIFSYTKSDLGHFSIHEEKLGSTVDLVIQTIHKNYPDLKIPFHSRWGHFKAEKNNRVEALNKQISSLPLLEQARIKFDLVIPSVLLDAGSGPHWKYFEKSTSAVISRSEGLGVASFHMFMEGEFSATEGAFFCSGSRLRSFPLDRLVKGFQVSAENPLVGLEGRLKLLQNLGHALSNTLYFPGDRPGGLVDYLVNKYGHSIPAEGVFRAVLDSLGSIWPGRIVLEGINLGDAWYHSKLPQENLLVFHKLSQWLTYSLIEPLEEAGIQVKNVNALTGLAEYRNGGLILDSELITLQDSENLQKEWKPSDDLILEWRALTVYFLDILGKSVRERLNFNEEQFPFAKVLEGGTWWAGRAIATQKREEGGPPLKIISDGTVF